LKNENGVPIWKDKFVYAIIAENGTGIEKNIYHGRRLVAWTVL